MRKTTKLAALLLAVMMIVSCIPMMASAEGATNTIVVDTVNAEPNETDVVVPVTITGDCCAVQFKVAFDGLTLTAVDDTDFDGIITTTLGTDAEDFGLIVEAAGAEDFDEATFDLVFTAPATEGTYAITVTDVDAADVNEVTVDFEAIDGAVIVASAEPEDTQVDVAFSHNVSFESNINVLFAAPAAAFAECESVYLNVEKVIYDVNGNETGTELTTITDYSTDVRPGYYAFYYSGAYSYELGSELRAVLYGVNADGSKIYTQTDVYSVLTYAQSRLSKTTNNAEKTALVDLLDYGSAAQTYFVYNTANLVIDKIDSSYLTYKGTLDASVVTDVSTTIANPGSTVALRKNMSFGSAIEAVIGFTASGSNLRMKFEYSDIHDGGAQKAYFVDASEFGGNASMYYAYFSKYTALEMDKTFKATLYDGDTAISDTLVYSTYSYAAAAGKNRMTGTDAYSILIQNMVRYGQSVTAFKS